MGGRQGQGHAQGFLGGAERESGLQPAGMRKACHARLSPSPCRLVAAFHVFLCVPAVGAGSPTWRCVNRQ